MRASASDEQARVAAGVAEVANGAGDLRLDRLEYRVQSRQRTGVEYLLLLPVLGQQRHLLDPRLQLGGVAVKVERALMDRLVLDPLRARHFVQHGAGCTGRGGA